MKKIIKLSEKTFFEGVTTSVFVFEAGKPQDDEEIFACYIEEDGLETVKNQGRQDIKDKWKTIEDYWIDIIKKQSGNDTIQWLMEDFIKDIEKKVQFSSVQFSLSSKTEKENVDCQKWKYFHLYDIFDIDMGTKLDRIKMKMDNPTIDFVGRANAGQGVTTRVNKIDGLEPYKSGYLTLALGGAYLGSCFIQKNNFYTSQNVIVLIPKREMTFKVKQFISTSIFVESQLHYKAFINELNPHIKTDFQFKLPINDKNNPDWEYMEKHIIKVEKEVYNRMNCLKQIIK